MVSYRCIVEVKYALKKLGINYIVVTLGEVEIVAPLSDIMRKELALALSLSRLELMEDKQSIYIQKIKNLIINLIHYTSEPLSIKLSVYVSLKLNLDYTYLANIFSTNQGTTIAKYFITQKIERVKELLCYKEMNIREIAEFMNYSSVAHLSSQFKKTTGLSPSEFKQMKAPIRLLLEEI